MRRTAEELPLISAGAFSRPSFGAFRERVAPASAPGCRSVAACRAGQRGNDRGYIDVMTPFPDGLRAGGLAIPEDELVELASRSSGPGGQHVNKSSTRVTLRWSVIRSRALDREQRERLLVRLGSRLTRAGELVVHADRARSRARNREAARRRLAELVTAALRVERSRRATAPTRTSRERRLESKRRQSLRKTRRRPVDRDEG